MKVDDRLRALRQRMNEESIDAYIIPSSDPHQSEYPPSRWKSREWITGFTGSAGTAVVTMDHAGLWTDSRYYLQAEKELSSNSFELHKMNNQFAPGYIEWLAEHLPPQSCVAIDGPLFSVAQHRRMEKRLANAHIELHVAKDIIGDVWRDRPSIPEDDIFEHDELFAGKSRDEKLSLVRKQMEKHDVTHLLISSLDDIGWLMNLRGYDVAYNPVFVSFAVVTVDNALLFINPDKVPKDLQQKLAKDNVVIQNYKTIVTFLNSLDERNALMIDESTINVALYRSIQKARIISGPSIVRNLKAVKNDTELRHFREVMVKDGLALTHAFKWLEDTLEDQTVSEFEFAEKLADFRSRQEHYYGESFSAIIGYEANGAIIHYRPEQSSSALIKKKGILLCDSGGQYLDGTTDITRTISFTEPTDEQKNAYTRVLKGHIALAQAQFPEGTTGAQLDTFARQFLWEDGLNFLHGTGHGVGFFMNVHEPPQGFAPGSSERATTVHKVGMVSSNEPGYYRDGAFGIRIENLVVARKAETEGFLTFDTITLFPIDTTLIDTSLFTEGETKWLNEYHNAVWTKLSPYLDDDHKSWLKRKCAPL